MARQDQESARSEEPAAAATERGKSPKLPTNDCDPADGDEARRLMEISGKKGEIAKAPEGEARPANATEVKANENGTSSRPGPEELQRRLDELRLKDHELDHELKETFGVKSIHYLKWQVLIADAVFCAYLLLSFCTGKEISGPAMVAWVSATVAEIIGVVVIIAKYLFPGKGNSWTADPLSFEDKASKGKHKKSAERGAEQPGADQA